MLNGTFLAQLFTPGFLIKIFFLVVLFMYLIFTFVVFNQVRLMNRIITQTPISTILSTIALIQIIAALSLFIAALAIL